MRATSAMVESRTWSMAYRVILPSHSTGRLVYCLRSRALHEESLSMSEQAKPAAGAGTVKLGDLTVNRMGYGAMRVTGKGIWGPPEDKAAALATLRRAVELGVDFIDTADSYGPNTSEELIAEALYPYSAGVVVATKGGWERCGPGHGAPNARP